MDTSILMYFSHDGCNVCKVLLPKIKELLDARFPKMKFKYIDIENEPMMAAQYRVFTAPTILVFFEDKEYYRFARNVSISELQSSIQRPYELLY